MKFNPRRVTRYRLLGFEKHRLNKEDFRNDKVDAAEMAAEEAGNAIEDEEDRKYEVLHGDHLSVSGYPRRGTLSSGPKR